MTLTTVESIADCLNAINPRNPDGNGMLHFTLIADSKPDGGQNNPVIDINGLPIPAHIIVRIVADRARPAIKRIRYFVSLPRDKRLTWHDYQDSANLDGTAAIDAKPETIARAIVRKVIEPLHPIAEKIGASLDDQQSRLDGIETQREWLASIGIATHAPRDECERLTQYSQHFYYSRGEVTLIGNIKPDGTLVLTTGTRLPSDLARVILPMLVAE